MIDINTLKNIEVTTIQKIKSSMKHLVSIYNELGIDDDEIINRVTTAWSHIESLAQDICDEERTAYEELKLRIKTHTEKITELSKSLSVEVSNEVGSTLLKREENLRQKCKALNELKEKRVKEFNNLQNLNKHYCLLLGMEECKSSKTEFPSLEELNKLQQHVNMLTKEHDKRHEKYCNARKELRVILEEIEADPESSLEKHLCSEEPPQSLTNAVFKTIEEIIAEAKKRKIELKENKKYLLEKLVVLWERLNIESEGVKFLSNHSDYKSSTLKSIEEEIYRCEGMKRQNIQTFIISTRQELTELWEKCDVLETEKELFCLYSSTEMTEEVLIAHEQEVERWKNHYEKIKLILEKIEKRKGLWELLMSLDNKANDPNRFKNRGGNLLKEEKERKKLQKTLPSLEDEIYKGIEIYEAETGKKFLYQGEDYRSYIYKQWQERGSKKDNAKQEKSLQVSTPLKRRLSPTNSAPTSRNEINRPQSLCTPKITKESFLPRPVCKKKGQDPLKEVNKGTLEISNKTFAHELNHTFTT